MVTKQLVLVQHLLLQEAEKWAGHGSVLYTRTDISQATLKVLNFVECHNLWLHIMQLEAVGD